MAIWVGGTGLLSQRELLQPSLAAAAELPLEPGVWRWMSHASGFLTGTMGRLKGDRGKKVSDSPDLEERKLAWSETHFEC